ncbi:MAG: glycosyltransferase family 4 protein [Anaerolineae bacterium]|nr:glycosyltransferase family 4 protein [Anaerolineae bacterium]
MGKDKRAIHVAVNAHLLSLAEGYRSAGINWYIYNLLKHLPEADETIRYTAFLGERRYPGEAGLGLRFSRLPTHRPQVRILWEQAIQPWCLRRAGVDLLHSPAFVGPLVTACPTVVTVHDLSFLLYPEGFRRWNRGYLGLFTRLSVTKARRVIAVSQSTRDDLLRHYGLSPDKVDVIHNGVDPNYRRLPADQVARFREHRGLPERFLLFVGTLEPRKNIVRLIEAYAQLPRSRPPLMLLGGRGWLYDEVLSRVEALALTDEVHFVGYVAAEELPLWYNAAEIFVYPSLYEGFGLPPLEAMACGTPVITSTASSLPEVVGRAGVLIDPTDVQALASAMAHLLGDAALQAELEMAGLEQASRFSWRKAARLTASSYREALTAGGESQRV